MGLNDNKSSGGNKIYLNIVNGKITRRFKEHLPEENGKPVTFAREIKDKNTGQVIKTVIERYHDSIDGIISDAVIDTSGDFGAMLVFTINSDEAYTLSVPLDSSYGRAIMKKIPNVDPNKEVEFAPFNFESKDEIKNGKPKKIVGCNIFQKNCGWDKDKVPLKWDKNNPGNLPSWKYSETTGKWDNTEELEFLGAHFMRWAKNVGAITTNNSSVDKLANAIDAEPEIMRMEEQFAKDKADNTTQEPDDLPF